MIIMIIVRKRVKHEVSSVLHQVGSLSFLLKLKIKSGSSVSPAALWILQGCKLIISAKVVKHFLELVYGLNQAEKKLKIFEKTVSLIKLVLQ